MLPLFSQLLNDLRGLAPAPIHLYSVGNHFEHFGINAPLVLARILPKLRRESIPIAWARRWRARLKGRAPNRGGGDGRENQRSFAKSSTDSSASRKILMSRPRPTTL